MYEWRLSEHQMADYCSPPILWEAWTLFSASVTALSYLLPHDCSDEVLRLSEHRAA